VRILKSRSQTLAPSSGSSPNRRPSLHAVGSLPLDGAKVAVWDSTVFPRPVTRAFGRDFQWLTKAFRGRSISWIHCANAFKSETRISIPTVCRCAISSRTWRAWKWSTCYRTSRQRSASSASSSALEPRDNKSELKRLLSTVTCFGWFMLTQESLKCCWEERNNRVFGVPRENENYLLREKIVWLPFWTWTSYQWNLTFARLFLGPGEQWTCSSYILSQD